MKHQFTPLLNTILKFTNFNKLKQYEITNKPVFKTDIYRYFEKYRYIKISKTENKNTDISIIEKPDIYRYFDIHRNSLPNRGIYIICNIVVYSKTYVYEEIIIIDYNPVLLGSMTAFHMAATKR